MPFTASQVAVAIPAAIDYFSKKDPVDQVNKARPLFSWFVDNKKMRTGGQQNAVYPVRKSNDSNYQNYFGDDQVSYNKKDTLAQVKYPWYDAHDGFTMNEDEAAQNGIVIDDDTYGSSANDGAGGRQMSDAETVQIVNIVQERYETLKLGTQEQMDIEFHLNGAQNAKAVPGLDALVSTTPTVGIVGGLDASTTPYWRNFTNLNIPTATPGNLVAQMEATWRACTTFGGGVAPDTILCSGAVLDAYARDVRVQPGQTVFQTGPAKGGVTLDGGRGQLYFKGVPLTWDPTMDLLDALYGAPTIPWAKRMYFLNSKTLWLAPVDGNWMKVRKPPRVYDRYAFFWGLTSKYSMCTNRRNGNAVLSIA